MGTVYKRGNVYYVDYRDNGKRIRKRIGPSYEAACDELKVLEGDVVRRKAGLSKQDMSVSGFVAKHLEFLKLDRKESSVRRYRIQLDHFNHFLRSQGVCMLSQVTPEIVERFKVHRLSQGVSKQTVNLALATVGAMFKRAVGLGYSENNPVSKVERLRVERRPAPRYLTGPEIERVKAVCSQTARDVFEVLIETGMRRGEIENLEWRDVDFAEGYIQIRPKVDWTPKHGRSRKIPIRPRVREILQRRKKGAWSPLVFHTSTGKRIRHIRDMLARAYKKAGVRNATVHTTRHTFASHAVMSGVDLYTVAKLLGHSDVKTTQAYSHLAQDHLRNQAERITFGLHVVKGTKRHRTGDPQPQPTVLQSLAREQLTKLR